MAAVAQFNLGCLWDNALGSCHPGSHILAHMSNVAFRQWHPCHEGTTQGTHSQCITRIYDPDNCWKRERPEQVRKHRRKDLEAMGLRPGVCPPKARYVICPLGFRWNPFRIKGTVQRMTCANFSRSGEEDLLEGNSIVHEGVGCNGNRARA